MSRTDKHNNPAAFTPDVAKQGGLTLGKEYVQGDAFPDDPNLFTAKLIGDPIALTIKVIDAIGFYTKGGGVRWNYIAIPKFLWRKLSFEQKRDVIGFMYSRETGTQMRGLFPDYGAV